MKLTKKKTKLKHLISAILLIISIKATSQTEVPIENWGQNYTNTYLKDINGHFNKFLGTWEYSTSDKYFKIRFYKVNKVPASTLPFYTGNKFYDYICSFIEYKEKQNGQWVTIYNTFNTPAFTSTNFSYDATQGYAISSDSNWILLDYTEPTETCRPRLSILNIRHQAGNPEQLLWERDTTLIIAGGKPNCENIDDSPFKIPANMVLTKVIPTLD
jgi:GR25 family glycosyltransferase involved in LPS biosynthesis